MQWSQLKKRITERFATGVAKRVNLGVSRYRHAHDDEGRGWLTVDGVEIASFCYFQSTTAVGFLTRYAMDAQGESAGRPYWEHPGYSDAIKWAASEGLKQGWLTREQFYKTLEAYLNLSIDDAIASPNPLVRGLAMLDGRFGKRRVKLFAASADSEHQLVRDLLAVRIEVEGMRMPGPDDRNLAVKAPRIPSDN